MKELPPSHVPSVIAMQGYHPAKGMQGIGSWSSLSLSNLWISCTMIWCNLASTITTEIDLHCWKLHGLGTAPEASLNLLPAQSTAGQWQRLLSHNHQQMPEISIPFHSSSPPFPAPPQLLPWSDACYTSPFIFLSQRHCSPTTHEIYDGLPFPLSGVLLYLPPFIPMFACLHGLKTQTASHDPSVQLQFRRDTVPALQELIQPVLAGPPLPLTDTVAPQQLADVDSRFLEVDGVTLHYKERGPTRPDAPVVVLLHGFNGSVFNWCVPAC